MMDISTDIVDLGPEMFASADSRVICWKGEHYYRACTEAVRENDDGGTTCILPEAWRHNTHKDHEGSIKEAGFSLQPYPQVVRERAYKLLQRTGLEPKEIFNALNALEVSGIVLSFGPYKDL